MESSLQVLWGELGPEGSRSGRKDHPVISPNFSALSSYRQEREGFLPSHSPAPGRKAAQFMDVSDPTGSVPPVPCPAHLLFYFSLLLATLLPSCSMASLFTAPAAPHPQLLPSPAALPLHPLLSLSTFRCSLPIFS